MTTPSASVAPNQTGEAPPGEEFAEERLPRWARWGMILVPVLVALFFAGGGWYFSSEIAADALAVEDDSDDYRFTVTAVADGQVTFAFDDHEDLLADEILGVAWLDGYGMVGARLDAGTELVTREYSHVGGSPLRPGTMVDLQGYAAPADPALVGIDVETVQYKSSFGEFDAWYVPGDDDTWAIFVHGRGAHPREGLRLLPTILDQGYPALLITYRNDEGQPATGDRLACFGATEWQDVEGAVLYAVNHGAQNVVLVGYSMGGAMAVSFMVESEEADEVRAVILDAPALKLGAMIDARADERSLPVVGLPIPTPLVTVAKWLTTVRYGVDWNEIDYLDRAAELDDPILLFHGTEDDSVPVLLSDRLAELRPDLVTYERFDGAGHVRAWNVDRARYEQAVLDFLAEHG